jgi:uncharacterized sulfatase
MDGTTMANSPAKRPNILWLSCEDMSAHLSCYGDPYATTPHLDEFAKQSVRYTHAFTTAGVCAPCRSAIITSMYQTTLGTHHMRCQAQLPDHVRPFPTYLREAGYYCTFKTYYQYMNTAEKGRTMQEIRRVQAAGTAPPGVALFLAENKPVEELYDSINDPHEMHNLADSPEYREILERMRAAHLDWVVETRDLGLVPEAEIGAREGELGSAWAILSRPDAGNLIQRLRDAASRSLEGPESLPQMIDSLGDEDAAVRYWAAVGLGNLGPKAISAAEPLRAALTDDAENVRVAAARALCRMNLEEKALPVLVEVLDDGSQWARLHASIVLDQIDEQARPVLEAMKRNKAYRKGLVANGKYTVRVLNRALNELLGTNDTVP